jgi:membrane protease YdiL (CAAX protease family)
MDDSLHKTISPQANDHFAAELRGFGPLGIIALLLILLPGTMIIGAVAIPLSALLVLLWVRLSHTPWKEIGYRKPNNWFLTIAAGILTGFVLKIMMKAIVLPLFNADPINHTYHYLAGNTAMLSFAVWAMLAAGFGEETVFRGFLFERLGKIFGSGILSRIAIILISSVLFGLGHYANQGLTGTEQATITGLVFGLLYAASGQIWIVMIAHAAFDLTALYIIYRDLETSVAHLFFH